MSMSNSKIYKAGQKYATQIENKYDAAKSEAKNTEWTTCVNESCEDQEEKECGKKGGEARKADDPLESRVGSL